MAAVSLSLFLKVNRVDGMYGDEMMAVITMFCVFNRFSGNASKQLYRKTGNAMFQTLNKIQMMRTLLFQVLETTALFHRHFIHYSYYEMVMQTRLLIMQMKNDLQM